MTNSGQWGTLKAPDGGIMGVYSLSAAEPLKKAGFRDSYAEFKDAKTYRDWKFVYLAPQQPGSAAPAPQPEASAPAVPG